MRRTLKIVVAAVLAAIIIGRGAQAAPDETALRQALAEKLGAGLSVQTLQFRNFHGEDASVGRTSLVGQLRVEESHYVRDNQKYARLEEELLSKGIDPGLSNLFRRGSGKPLGPVYTISAEAGSVVPFSGEFVYEERVTGYAFRGELSFEVRGQPINKLRDSATTSVPVFYGGEDFAQLLAKFEQLHANHVESFPKRPAEISQLIGGGFDVFLEEKKIGTIHGVDASNILVKSYKKKGGSTAHYVSFLTTFFSEVVYTIGGFQTDEFTFEPSAVTHVEVELDTKGAFYIPYLEVLVTDHDQNVRLTLVSALWEGAEFKDDDTGIRLLPAALERGVSSTVAEVGTAAFSSAAPAALEGAAGLVADAEALYAAALEALGVEQAEAFRDVQSVLDQILADHPMSDEAVQLALDLPIGIVDPVRVREGMAVAVAAPGAAPSSAGANGRKDLASLVATCLGGAESESTVRGDLQVTVAAQVGPTGEVVGLPALVTPATVDADARLLFLRALSAIDACAPFDETVRNQNLTVTLDAGGLVFVAVGVEPAREEPLPTTPYADQWHPATQADEQALGLDRVKVREVQGRLASLGFDPRGVDGNIGVGTRAAISAWQDARSIVATGFLNTAQLAALRQESQARYADWLRGNPAAAPRAAAGTSRATNSGTAPQATNTARRSSNPTGRYVDERGCLREPNGRFVANFRQDCR